MQTKDFPAVKAAKAIAGKQMQYYRSMMKDSEEDEDNDGQPREMYLSFAERTYTRSQIIVPIDGNFLAPAYYRAVVERIDNLAEDDELVFKINSKGGRLAGLLSLLDAINSTDASTVAHIQGECHSAASILALNCDAIHVSPYSSMLVHYVSFGAGGKGMDVVDMVQHTIQQSNDIIVSTYQGFCTEEEIAEIIKGKQLWLRYEDIVQRLQNKMEFMKSQEEPEPVVETQPKKTKQLKS